MTAAESERPLRVLVADDHPPTRDDIRRALERAGIQVCGEAANAAEAVRAALASRPDVCLLDLNMPGHGIAAVWEIGARLPTTRIVILTVSEEEAYLLAALRAGAASYLVKNFDFRRLPQALREVHEGRASTQRTLVAATSTRFGGANAGSRSSGSPAVGPRLTSREWEVLTALGDGLSTRGIGRRLGVKPRAVRADIASLVRKLGVANRHEVVAMQRHHFEVQA